MGAIGNMQAYMQFKAARAIGDAARTGWRCPGAGIGLGAGMGMGHDGGHDAPGDAATAAAAARAAGGHRRDGRRRTRSDEPRRGRGLPESQLAGYPGFDHSGQVKAKQIGPNIAFPRRRWTTS